MTGAVEVPDPNTGGEPMASNLKYGYVAPMLREGSALIQSLEKKQETRVHGRRMVRGFIGDKECVVIISGCGKINSASATQLLIDTFDLEEIIHFGCAGALSNELKIGDLVLADTVIEYDYYRKFGRPERLPEHETSESLSNSIFNFCVAARKRITKGRILSGNEDIVTTARRDELLALHQGLSVDWESAGCVAVCNQAQVHCAVLRGIVDFAYEGTHEEFPQNLQKVSAALCEALIQHALQASSNTD
ncbi:MAG: 5'-methylthioadenosine/S-adenosylhomocysteine nucleosidase [Bdellovibrionota bacterium]